MNIEGSSSLAPIRREPRRQQQQAVAQKISAAAQGEAERRKRTAPFQWSEPAAAKIRADATSLPSLHGNSEVSSRAAQRRFADSFAMASRSEGAKVASSVTAACQLKSFGQVMLVDISDTEIDAELSAVTSKLDVASSDEWAGSELRSTLRKDLQRLDDMINASLDHAAADRKRGRTHTGVKAFKAFCNDVLGISADRPLDPLTTPLVQKLEEEWLCMRFICALVEQRGITPSSAYVYFSAVQGWHAREHGVKLCAGLKLERLPQMLKGLRRIVGEEPRAIRRGIAPQMLKKSMDMLLDPESPKDANIRAALAVALQGLLRSKEYCGFDKPELVVLRSDLTELNDERCIIMMHPCKNMNHVGGKTCPIVIGAGGKYVDSVAELRNLLRVDPTPVGRGAHTPLFRDPETNAPLSYDLMLNTVKRLMGAIGEEPKHFGTHSLRIGGATALFTQGANETIIRTMGRWSSDLHRLYVRACFEQCVEWTKKAGSATVSDLAGTFDEVDYY